MGILGDDRNILRHFLLELFPTGRSFLLIRLGERSYPEEDQEREYQGHIA